MSDNKEQCRAEFEARVRNVWANEENAPNLSRDAVGDYMDADMFGRFVWWQAAWDRAAQPVVLTDEHPFFQLFLCTLGALALHDQKNAEEYGAKARAILAAKEQA